MPQIYIAAGSNVDPLRHLRRALAALDRSFGPLQVSPAYRNKAVGFEGEDFVNLVVAFMAHEPIATIRERLQQIEQDCDRLRDAPKWAPRTMDLDILLYGDLVLDEPGLILPRPDLVKRPYMLKPMADLAPNLLHPTLHRTMRELWETFDAQGHIMQPVELGEW